VLGSDFSLNARFHRIWRIVRQIFGPLDGSLKRASARGGSDYGPRILRWLSATRRAQFTAGLTCALLFGVFFGALIVANIRSTAPLHREPEKRTARVLPAVPVPVRVRVTEQQVPRQPAARQPEPLNGSAEPLDITQGASGTDAKAFSAAGRQIPVQIDEPESRPEARQPASDPNRATHANAIAGRPPASVEPDASAVSAPIPEPRAPDLPAMVKSAPTELFGPALPHGPTSQSQDQPVHPALNGPATAMPEVAQTAALTSRGPGETERKTDREPSASKANSPPAAAARLDPVKAEKPDAPEFERLADLEHSVSISTSAQVAALHVEPAEAKKADAPSPAQALPEPDRESPVGALSVDAAPGLGSEVIDARSAGAAKVVEPSASPPPIPALETPALIGEAAKPGAPPQRIAALPVPGGGQWLKNAVAMPQPTGRPMIAIVIDDVGINQARTRRTIDLPAPLTLSFIPYGYNLKALVASARKAGHEILVHIPMEPLDLKWNPGPNALLTNHDNAEILRRLRWGLDQFDGYVGVSNHMGSKFTAWRPGMTTVLREIRSRGLLFLDSWTSNRSLGLAMSQEINIPSVARDIFIDHDISRSEIQDSLGKLERIARRRGFAIGIGHPHDLTTSILAKWIDQVRLRGVDLVPISSIVRRRRSAG